MSHQPERALTPFSAVFLILKISFVEMSHQPERALTPLTSNDISYGKMRRNESSAREGIDTTAPVEGVVHWP